MFKFLLLIVLACFTQEYKFTISSSQKYEKDDALLFSADTIESSAVMDIAKYSKITLFVTGIDSTLIILQSATSGAYRKIVSPDSGSGMMPIDTISVDGVYEISSLLGAYLQLNSTEDDDSVKVYGILSTRE